MRLTESCRMRWADHVVCFVGRRCAYGSVPKRWVHEVVDFTLLEATKSLMEIRGIALLC
jgi:hypothetical protein